MVILEAVVCGAVDMSEICFEYFVHPLYVNDISLNIRTSQYNTIQFNITTKYNLQKCFESSKLNQHL